MAGPPTAGTSIVAGTAVSVSGVQYGNVLIASGAVTSLSAITKTALLNGEIQVDYSSNYDSWKANKKTSITHGKQIEARVKGKNVKIRVDSEPQSGKFQVQSGSGKSGYPLNEHLRIDRIIGKDSIVDWVNSNESLSKLSRGVREQIIDRIWKAYQRYYAN